MRRDGPGPQDPWLPRDDDAPDEGWSARLLIADASQHIISLAGEAGVVLAGTPGQPGFVDGPAALFDQPSGLALDDDGHIYVADRGNHAIRKLYPDGRVETIAGGPDAAAFDSPTGVAYERINDRPILIVADTGHHCLRWIDLEDPAYPVGTLAGSCGEPGAADGPADQAQFAGPQGLDAWLGKIFVTDQRGVRRLSEVDGVWEVSTILARPGVQSVFADDRSNLYITSQGHSAVEFLWLRFRDAYDPPLPLQPCGGSMESPQTTATFFGHLIVADGDTLKVISETAPPTGVKRDCPRCGPRIPIQQGR